MKTSAVVLAGLGALCLVGGGQPAALVHENDHWSSFVCAMERLLDLSQS